MFMVPPFIGRIFINNKGDKNLIYKIHVQWQLYIQCDLPQKIPSENEYWLTISELLFLIL